MQVTRRFLTVAAVAGIALGAASGGHAADSIKVAIGQKGLWDTMVTVHGIEEGFFAEEDLDVEVIWTRGGAETLQAAVTGSVQFAMANGILGVLSAYEKGAPIRVVSAEITGSPDVFWYARSESGIDGLADAGGKTMGFSREGSSSHLVALELAKAAGVEPDLTPTGGISATRTQVLSRQIDIGWSVPPFNLDLVREGEIKIVARGSDLPSLNDQTVRVNVVNADFLKDRRDTVERFMRAYARTTEWMYESRDAAVARFAAFNDLSLQVAQNAADFYPKESVAVAPVKGLERSVQHAIDHGRLSDPLTDAEMEELIDIVYAPGGA